MKLTVVGMGVDAGDMSVNALKKIKSSPCVILRTENTNSARFLKEEGINFSSLDFLYEKSRNFETLKRKIVAKIKEKLKESDVCYVVDGAVSEDKAAAELISKIKDAEVYEGVSKIGRALSMSGLGGERYYAVSAYELINSDRISLPIVVYDIDSDYLAGMVKLSLMQYMAEDVKVRLYVDNQCKTIKLYELDRENCFNYSAVLVAGEEKFTEKSRFTFEDLYKILKILRSPQGCPWDKVQTEKSIIKNLIEETYELVDAVNLEDDDKMREETGDLLLQVAFYMLFAEERGAYTKGDVISELCRKLIDRHTHIFGGDHAENSENALEIWNKNKQTEKKYGSVYNYVNDVPKTLPSLMRASKVVKRAIKSDADIFGEQITDTLFSQLEKLKNGECADTGELLFYLVYYLAQRDETCEEHLIDATNRFVEALGQVEKALNEQGKTFKNATSDEKKNLFFKR